MVSILESFGKYGEKRAVRVGGESGLELGSLALQGLEAAPAKFSISGT